MDLTKHFIWAAAVIIVVGLLCMTVLILNNNPYPIRLEMDNNTLEAVKTINWSAMYSSKEDSDGKGDVPSQSTIMLR